MTEMCDEQQRTKQWIEDVRKAMNEGVSIPDKPEEIDIAYPSLEIRKKTPEEAPDEEASHKQTPPQGTPGQDPLEEEVPAYKMPPEDKDQDSVPLEEAVAQVCGPQEDERPPAPLEPEVVIINMPAPAAALCRDRDIEANKAGGDMDQGDGADSDCQIVDENPQEAPRPKTHPTGTVEVKEGQGHICHTPAYPRQGRGCLRNAPYSRALPTRHYEKVANPGFVKNCG